MTAWSLNCRCICLTVILLYRLLFGLGVLTSQLRCYVHSSVSHTCVGLRLVSSWNMNGSGRGLGRVGSGYYSACDQRVGSSRVREMDPWTSLRWREVDVILKQLHHKNDRNNGEVTYYRDLCRSGRVDYWGHTFCCTENESALSYCIDISHHDHLSRS